MRADAMSVPTTALYVDLGAELQAPQAPDERAPAFFDEASVLQHVHRAQEPALRISQVDASARLRTLRLEKFLGSGGSGAAFLCEHPASPARLWVVKLPVTCLRAPVLKACAKSAFACRGWSVAQTLDTANLSEATRAAARRSFAQECNNAEHALEPPEMREARVVGQRLQGLTVAQYRRIVEARRTYQVRLGLIAEASRRPRHNIPSGRGKLRQKALRG